MSSPSASGGGANQPVGPHVPPQQVITETVFISEDMNPIIVPSRFGRITCPRCSCRNVRFHSVNLDMDFSPCCAAMCSGCCLGCGLMGAWLCSLLACCCLPAACCCDSLLAGHAGTAVMRCANCDHHFSVRFAERRTTTTVITTAPA